MNTFTIDTDNNIMFHMLAPDAREDRAAFGSRQEFDALTGGWPLQRLVEVYNSFAGTARFDELKPVKKFENRQKATRRIWEAIQRLTNGPSAATIVEEDESMKTKSKAKPAARAKKAPKVKAAAAVASSSDGPREGTKQATLVELMSKRGGTSIEAMMKATGWQKHSVRGAIATLHTKLGYNITSEKTEDGKRIYAIA